MGESGSGKSVTALSVLKLLPYPTASHPSGRILFKGEDLLDADERDLRRVRGDDITMIFQEPMTSLNPLHTIERQIAEILTIHHGMSDAEARDAHDRAPEPGRHPRPGKTPRRLPAPDVGRAAPARDDRHGARQRAGAPDRRRADHRTRRHGAGADPGADARPEGNAQGLSMLFITHDLGIVRKFADRVCVMTGGKIVEEGPTREIFENPQHEYTRHLLDSEPKGEPPEADPTAPVVLEGDDIKRSLPHQGGLSAPHGGRGARGRRHRRAAARGPDAGRGGRVRLGQDDPGAGAHADDQVAKGASPSWGAISASTPSRR